MGRLEAGVENSVPTREHRVRRKKEVETTPPKYHHPRLCKAVFCTDAGHTGHVREGQVVQLPRWFETMGSTGAKSKECYRCGRGNCCCRKAHRLCFLRRPREKETIFRQSPSKTFSREGARGRTEEEELPQRAEPKRQGLKTWRMLLVRRTAHGKGVPTEAGTQRFDSFHPPSPIGQGQSCCP